MKAAELQLFFSSKLHFLEVLLLLLYYKGLCGVCTQDVAPFHSLPNIFPSQLAPPFSYFESASVEAASLLETRCFHSYP